MPSIEFTEGDTLWQLEITSSEDFDLTTYNAVKLRILYPEPIELTATVTSATAAYFTFAAGQLKPGKWEAHLVVELNGADGTFRGLTLDVGEKIEVSA